MATIQLDIERFIFRTGKNPWMAEGRRYLPPSEGGMGAINIVTYAQSLRCSWYKRIKSGLWSNILTSKVSNKENCCFIIRKDIHSMHISILPIADAFEALQKKFLKDKGNTARLNTPLDQIELIEQRPATRTAIAKMSKSTKTTHSFLSKKGNIFEITGAMLTTKESLSRDMGNTWCRQSTIFKEM